MGLFHYLLIIRTVENKVNEKFFIENENFIIVEKTKSYVSLAYKTDVGDIEIYIDNDKEFSIRTKIQNEVQVIEKIILILQRFAEKMKNNITIYDVQNKQLLDLSNIKDLNKLYLKRKTELEKFL